MKEHGGPIALQLDCGEAVASAIDMDCSGGLRTISSLHIGDEDVQAALA